MNSDGRIPHIRDSYWLPSNSLNSSPVNDTHNPIFQTDVIYLRMCYIQEGEIRGLCVNEYPIAIKCGLDEKDIA